MTSTHNICRICGKEINVSKGDSITYARVVPATVERWLLQEQTDEENNNFHHILSDERNFVPAHTKCDLQREDAELHPSYIGEEESVSAILFAPIIAPYLKKYKDKKEKLLVAQNWRCYECDGAISGKSSFMVRRNKRNANYSNANACVVCKSCKKHKPEF